MKEKDYCRANDLGQVTSALSVLRGIVPNCGHSAINKAEYMEVIGLVTRWQTKIFKSIDSDPEE